MEVHRIEFRRVLVVDVHGRDSVCVVDGVTGDGNLSALRSLGRAHSRESKRADDHARQWIIHHRVVRNHPIQLRCTLGEAIVLPKLDVLSEIEEVDHRIEHQVLLLAIGECLHQNRNMGFRWEGYVIECLSRKHLERRQGLSLFHEFLLQLAKRNWDGRSSLKCFHI